MAKKMIIKGVGTFMAKRYAKDGKGVEVITLGTLQDLKINLNVDIEDIFGGDGLFAIDTLVKSKSIEISATDAKFDLDALQLMMGSTVQEQVESYVWVLGEQQTIDSTGTVTPKYGGATPTIFGDGNFSVRLKDSNTLLKKVTVAPAAATEYQYDEATGTLKFMVSEANKDVVINYQRTETVDLVDILIDEVPFPVHVIHHGSFLQKDNTYAGVETELYSCRAKGTFSIDGQRASASASAVSLTVLDPERTDGKLGTIKRYSSVAKA
jgi:hypothetical protein